MRVPPPLILSLQIAKAAVVQVDPVDRWGSTPLLEALTTHHLDVAEALIDKGARIDENQFMLVKAAAESDIAKLELMCLKAGINANSKDYDSRTPLHTSCAAGNLKAVKSLLKVGANVNCRDRCARPASPFNLRLLCDGMSFLFGYGGSFSRSCRLRPCTAVRTHCTRSKCAV